MDPAANQDESYREFKRDLWMSALALVSIGIGLYQLGQGGAVSGMTALDYVDLGIVVVFIAEFALSARRAGSFRAFLARRWWELPSMIPITGGMISGMGGISLVRSVRLLRLVRAVRLLRVVSVGLRLRRVSGFIARVYSRSQAGSLVAVAAVIVLLGAVAAFAAESRHSVHFATFQNSLWWSLNMFTNVAYVDFQPATGLGRLLAGILQVFGIAFIGIFAGSMANAIMQESKPPPAGERSAT